MTNTEKTKRKKPIYDNPKKMAEKIISVENELRLLSRRVGSITAKVRSVDEGHMVSMEARQSELTKAFQFVIEKMTVATEVSYYARHTKGISEARRYSIIAAAIWAMDRPESWWQGCSGLSVIQWAERCLDAYRSDKSAAIIIDELAA